MSDPTKIPPTLEEVQEYLAGFKSKTSAEEFILFYEERGWFAGRHKMKNWQAAAQRWHRNGWGMAKEAVPAKALSEWERKTKSERIRDLQERIRSITNPGGCAYPIKLNPAKIAVVDALQAEIDVIKKELSS